MNIKISFEPNGQVTNYRRVARKLQQSELFTRNRLYVLPKIPRKFRQRVVYFPHYNDVEHTKMHMRGGDTVSELSESVLKESVANKGRASKLISSFVDQQRDYSSRLNNIDLDTNGFDLDIRISLFGTIGSYRLPYSRENNSNSFIILPRVDSSVEDIWATILTAFANYQISKKTDFEGEDDNEGWRDKQEKAKEYISVILPKYKSFIETIDRSTIGKLALESNQYLNSLGIQIPSYAMRVEEELLTNKEKELFKLLQMNRDKIVTFEEIGDCLWGKEASEVYSLYALTKLTQRLRDKIKQSGVESKMIHTQRGVGYYLYE